MSFDRLGWYPLANPGDQQGQGRDHARNSPDKIPVPCIKGHGSVEAELTLDQTSLISSEGVEKISSLVYGR